MFVLLETDDGQKAVNVDHIQLIRPYYKTSDIVLTNGDVIRTNYPFDTTLEMIDSAKFDLPNALILAVERGLEKIAKVIEDR